MGKSVLLMLCAAMLCVSCSVLELGIDEVSDPPTGVLLIADQDIYPSVASSLSQYIADLGDQDIPVYLEVTGFGSAEELRSFIHGYSENIDTAFLVGDLPAARYEQTAFGNYESFPCDIYLMSAAADWSDSDSDGIYDGHGKLSISIVTSRVIGSADELNSYFAKAHTYRISPFNPNGSAFIFKDDDWFTYKRGSDFNLGRIYPNVQINEDETTTVLSKYNQELLPPRVDYVYQWIHANPTSLHIYNQGEFEVIRDSQINSSLTGVFYNLFDCSAARFTQTNLGMSYLMKTETALAVLGSTKVGGNYYPTEFHRSLSLGSSWGNAFKAWYNHFGSYDDEWFLGMVILGDPTLRLTDAPDRDASASLKSVSTIIPPDEEERESLFRNLLEVQKIIGDE